MGKESRKVIKDMNSVIDKEVIGLVLDLQEDLIAKTPIDTGWARSNWLSSTSLPITATTGMNDSIKNTKWTLVSGDPIFIVNNVHYITLLNAGWSRQQPKPGYVERGILRTVAKYDGKKLA